MKRSIQAAVAAMLAWVVVFGAIGAAAAPQEQANSMPLLTLAGAHSKIDEPLCVRITTAEDFQKLYMRHLGEDPKRFDKFYNPHGVPVIDFDRCLVLAVFRGQTWNRAGVYVHSAEEANGRLLVRVQDRSYQTFGPDGGGNQVTPFGIFVMPHNTSEMIVELDVRSLIDAPPEWKEIDRFPETGDDER